MLGDMAPGDLVQKIFDLEREVTILKAERDEAQNGAREVWQKLLNLLARIHRDGGHYTDKMGLDASMEKADQLIAALHTTEDLEGSL